MKDKQADDSWLLPKHSNKSDSSEELALASELEKRIQSFESDLPYRLEQKGIQPSYGRVRWYDVIIAFREYKTFSQYEQLTNRIGYEPFVTRSRKQFTLSARAIDYTFHPEQNAALIVLGLMYRYPPPAHLEMTAYHIRLAYAYFKQYEPVIVLDASWKVFYPLIERCFEYYDKFPISYVNTTESSRKHSEDVRFVYEAEDHYTSQIQRCRFVILFNAAIASILPTWVLLGHAFNTPQQIATGVSVVLWYNLITTASETDGSHRFNEEAKRNCVVRYFWYRKQGMKKRSALKSCFTYNKNPLHHIWV